MKQSNIDIPLITLPSLLRRVINSNKLKTLVRTQGGELKRIGRSRNWQLKATFEQLEIIITAIEQSDESTWQWLAPHLAKQRKNLSFDMLLAIATDKPNITVSELMMRTDCTIVEARKVIDTLEFGESAT